MLDDYAGWRWRSYLDMGLANWSKCQVLASRHLCGVFSQNNGSFSELEHQRFTTFLFLNRDWYRLMTVEKTMGLKSVQKSA